MESWEIINVLHQTEFIRVLKSLESPGKSWNFIMAFSRTGKFWKSVKLKYRI